VWRSYLDRCPGIIATIGGLLGLLTLLDALLPEQSEWVHAITGIIPMAEGEAAAAVSAVSGLMLLRVAAALRKRKRRAWGLAVGVTLTLVIAYVPRGHHPLGESLVALVLLLLLLTARSRFTAKSDPVTRWFAARVGAQFFAVAVIYGISVFYLSPNRVGGHPSFWLRLQQTVYGLVGMHGPLQLRGHRFPEVVHATLLGFGLLTAVSVALLALRPAEPIARLSPADETRLRELLRRHGARDSLGYFATRRDKSIVWSATGKAAITYRVVHGVALASGDPVGDPEAWPGAIAAYQNLVQSYGWTAAVIGCSELGATIFRRDMNLSALAIGDEAILDVADFTLEGRSMRGVRQACGRIERSGYDLRVRRASDIGDEELAELLRVAAEWRGNQVERGFSMALSRLGDRSDGDCVLVTAHAGERLTGLLHFVPWGPHGLSLDVMRRDRDADNGLNEFLIVTLIQACPELNVTRVSLNFVVFRDAIERGQKIGAGPILRVWRRVLVYLSRWWQIESLYRFNVKFRPDWEPRLLSYAAARDLPRITLAALEAEAFLVRPHGLKRMLGRG
jgi:lysyl-tRNA synthetase class 2